MRKVGAVTQLRLGEWVGRGGYHWGWDLRAGLSGASVEEPTANAQRPKRCLLANGLRQAFFQNHRHTAAAGRLLAYSHPLGSSTVPPQTHTLSPTEQKIV